MFCHRGPRQSTASCAFPDQRKDLVIATVKNLGRLFAVPRSRWLVLSLLVVTSSATEALAAALVFALVNLMSTGEVDLPVLGAVTSDQLGLFSAGVVVVFLVRAAVVIVHDTVLYRLCYGAGADLEERLLRGYLALPPRELRRRGHAELVRNVHDTVMSVVEEALIPSVLAVGAALRAAALIAVMVAVAPVPTLFAGLLFAPVFWLISRGVRRPARRLGAEVEVALEQSLRTATETLALAADIRMAGKSASFARRFGKVRRDLARAGGAEEVIRSFPRLAAETGLVLFVVGLVGFASARDAEEAVLPTLGLFAYAALRVLPSLIGLVGVAHSVAHAQPALQSVLADEALLAEVPTDLTAARPAPTTVALRGVSVRVPETGRQVLRDVDLELHRGDVVAVVGPNGAGKSTLMDVIAGSLAPHRGQVVIDGEPLAEREATWQAQVAMVPQHVHLLDSDVLTNITLDVSSDDAVDQRLATVVAEVGLGPVIERLGDRTVGEDGRMLSGGERQRVAVARALYRNAPVLLVDEGTSALDSTSRTALQDLVNLDRERRITVLVTHDPELSRSCTRVVRVEGGRVWAEDRVPGSHD
jgi:ABC-type multidrug transport system fused ATPase/permease subunit